MNASCARRDLGQFLLIVLSVQISDTLGDRSALLLRIRLTGAGPRALEEFVTEKAL